MKNTPRPVDQGGFAHVFRTLRYRNYRLFYAGQLVSLIGTWMQQVAMTWLVYRMTNSPFLLGVVGFAGQMPAFLMSAFAGVLADRGNRHRMLILTQSLAMAQASVLAVLTLTGAVAVWHLVSLSIFLGMVNAFDVPIRQSFLLDMIENKEDLGNAIALNSSLFNGARLIGPAIAGLIIAALGEGACFVLNALSYIAVIAALAAMEITPRKRAPTQQGVLKGLAEGFRYVAGSPPIRRILLLLAVVSLTGMPYSVLMPIFARDILGGGPNTLGFLMGATGVGALTGALLLASRKSVVGLGRWIPLAAGVFGAGLAAFTLSHAVWLSMLLLTFVGLGMMLQIGSSNTILQTIVDDDKRGRVMSFYAICFLGMAPFGSLLAGSLAGSIGAPKTLFISGIVCIIAAIIFARQLPSFRNEVRPIYARLGIIPEVSPGMYTIADAALPPGDRHLSPPG